MVSVTDLHTYLACLVAESDVRAIRSQCRLKRIYIHFFPEQSSDYIIT